MTRSLLTLALGTTMALAAVPPDVFAGGRGGGYGGGGRGGYGGGESREGRGGSGGTPSFSQPREPSNGSRNEGGSSYGQRPPSGSPSSGGNRNESSTQAGAAAAGAGAENRNQPKTPSAAGSAAAGADYANRNQKPSLSNAGSAAAGADYANRNQKSNMSNAGAAAAGAGYADRNQQPKVSNAGAAAAGAGYANRNQQPNISNAGAAVAGAGYANRNQQPNVSNAGAAAAGAAYANNNAYNRYHPGMVNGHWNGNNSGAWGGAGVGLGAAGVGAWGVGSPMYSYGYSGYNNPYAGAGGVAQGAGAPSVPGYNYSQPIGTAAAPPEAPVIEQAASAFDQAREAFKAGDYANAAQIVQPALTQTPNDTAMHEFLALALFAQGKYDQAAAPLYAVLSVGPGWDWTTLSGMYPDVQTYTTQLRALEAYISANPRSANARFVLAYQYLCQGHDADAIAQLKQVVKLQPGDTLSAQLVARSEPAAPATVPVATASAPGVEGKLTGKWSATPAKGVSLDLVIQGDGRFTWTNSAPGTAPTTIGGTSTYGDGVLKLSDGGGPSGDLTGNVVWKDADHFNFRLAGAPANDPGLNFSR